MGTDAVACALEAVALTGMEREEDVRTALRCHLVTRADRVALFDEAFRLFWRHAMEPNLNADLAHQTLGASVARLALQRRLEEAARRVPWRWQAPPAGAGPEPSFAAAPPGARGPAAAGGAASQPAPNGDVAPDRRPAVARGGYSPREVLRVHEHGGLAPPEREELRRFMQALAGAPRRTGRRWAPGARGNRWDLARTARRALATAGELVELRYRRRRVLPRRVVLLLDVSGSMETYARPLLAAAHALVRRWGQVEVFAFGTRLTRLTRELARQQPDLALAEATRRVVDWAGGTRIGQSLAHFNRRWARQVLRRAPVVVLVSDGWDRGDLELLGRELARLRAFCRWLVWVTPLPVSTDSAHLPAGLRAALPHVDAVVRAGTLEDLHRLAGWLVAGEDAPRLTRRPGASRP